MHMHSQTKLYTKEKGKKKRPISSYIWNKGISLHIKKKDNGENWKNIPQRVHNCLQNT